MTMRYRIYPSLLDAFSRYVHSEGYVKKRNLQSLLDAVNHVKRPSEEADKGTAFNAIMDGLIHGSYAPSPSFSIDDGRADGIICARSPQSVFYFDREWCFSQSRYFEGAESQVFVSALLPVKYGEVELYGIVDELKGKTVYDIKTTSRYYPGKYAGGWQRHVYPYCLTQSGREIESFEYVAFELKGGKGKMSIINGDGYIEEYPYNHKESCSLLTSHCEDFISFLEENRNLITDSKIFIENE